MVILSLLNSLIFQTSENAERGEIAIKTVVNYASAANGLGLAQ